MDNFLLLSGLSAISWAISVILDKQYLLKYFKAHELYVVRACVGIPLLILYFIFVILDKHIYQKTINMDFNMLMIIITTIILSFIGFVLFSTVLSNNKAVYAVSCVHPLFIIFSMLLSFFLFKEKINIYEGFGIFLVILGIIIINYYKDYKN
jgi:drug/metabolite transporter (DMT)-like permease